MKPEEELFERVRFAREGADVERCHTHPHALRYSVGHHSLNMVTLITVTWQAAHGTLPRAELLIAAAAHDLPELVIGDIPSPTRGLLDRLLDGKDGMHLTKVENRVLEWLGMGVSLSVEETEWLEAADAVELFLWCVEEVQLRGNLIFLPWIEYYQAKWRDQPVPPPFMALVYHSGINRGLRTSPAKLKEVAGL